MRFSSRPEVPWLVAARKYIGVAEIPGVQHSPIIVGWLKKLKAQWFDDEVPWCGTFVGVCMSEAGIVLPQFWYRARDWMNWGVKLDEATVGCVVVYSRTGGGHVGFVVGKDKAGNIMTLGGNQHDAVNIKPFDPARVLGFRWPAHEVLTISPLPIVNLRGEISTQEG
jgi:uncharacterized protein (TIGR02594 family)